MSETQSLNVVLIEDDGDHAEAIRRHIRRFMPRSQISHFFTLTSGLDGLVKQKPDVVLLDLRLPDCELHETLVAVVRHVPNLPIVVLSSLNDEELASKSLLGGAQDYICKEDLTPESIGRAIRHSIERKQLESKLKLYAERLESKNSDLERLVAERTAELSSSEQQFRSLVNLAPLGIIRLTSMGLITFANPEFNRIFCYEQGETDRLHLPQLVHREDIQQLELAMLKLSREYERPLRESARLIGKDRKEHWCHLTISSVSGNKGDFDHFVCIIDDITEQKARETLEREKTIAEESNRAKTDFLTNISHEIRTPLAAVTGFVDIALGSSHIEEKDHYLQIIKRNSKHLFSLVNDLLDLSKIEAGQLDINKSHFSLVSEVETVVSIVKGAANEKAISIEIKYLGLLPSNIYTDPQKFRQILINLINNSIKYTERGSIIVTFQISFGATGSLSTLNVTVEDTGQGIDPSVVSHLFQPFARGENARVLKKEGLGVGLALSRNLARKMGGDITLLSTSRQGTKFKLIVEIGAVEIADFTRSKKLLHRAATGETSKLPPDTRLADAHILIAEDAVDLQLLVRHYLEKHGARVDICGDGKSAVELALQNKYSCVLMDIQMPIMTGDEATKELRRKNYKGTIIALTAHAFRQERDYCIASGFDGFLTKPVYEAEMIALIKSFLADKAPDSQPDLTFLYEDDPIIREAAILFLNNMKANIIQLESAISNENWDSVAKIAHKIKGSSGCYGYPQMSELSFALENEAKTSHIPANAFPILNQLSSLAQQALHNLESVVTI